MLGDHKLDLNARLTNSYHESIQKYLVFQTFYKSESSAFIGMSCEFHNLTWLFRLYLRRLSGVKFVSHVILLLYTVENYC